MKKAFLFLALVSAPLSAQNISGPPGYEQLKALPVPVIAGDVTDRPYRVIGTVIAGVRKATMFSKSPSEGKVYRELWERGQKMGADAVINAQYGEAHITALSWGSREARGTAIKFLTDAEIATLPKPPATSLPAAPAPVAPTPEPATPIPEPQSYGLVPVS